MILNSLHLCNFRNYADEVIAFSPLVNVIFGKNGSGKTNLLEALHLISTGRSFRTLHLPDLIREGSSYFYIEAHFEKDSIQQKLSIGCDGQNKKIHYNASILPNFSNLPGILPSTLYLPRDGQLISGSPQERRRFLNVLIAQSDPLYIHHLIRYQKALKQRNALLKSKSEAGIESWEEMMAQSAQYLMQKRAALLKALQPKMALYEAKLSDEQDTFELSYLPSIPFKHFDSIREMLKKNRRKEISIGTTLIGPHRDDFSITYKQQEAKAFASEGQKRTCIAALKLAEWELLSSSTGEKALLGIDDFCIHLDENRTHLLHSELQDCGQIFLTTPSEEHLEKFSHNRLLFVDKGNVTVSV